MKTKRTTKLILPILAVVAFCIGTGVAQAALSEGFNATGWGASYGTYTVNGWTLTSTWRETGSMYEGVAAIRFATTAGTGRHIVSPQNAAGIGTVSFWHRRWSAADGTVNFDVYVSTDGSTWGTAVGSGSSSSDTYSQYSLAVNNAAAKYVKIQINSGKRWLVDLAAVSDPAGATAPAVTTVAADTIATTTAKGNGNVTADGGATVTERGVCFKTSSGVAITDNKTAAAAGGTGTYSVDLSSLSVNQIYYFKAYAQNSVGATLAANELNFTTLANVPAAPTVDNPTVSTLDVAVNANGNPASTEFAIQRTSDSQYLQADGTFGASAAWQTAATWGTKTATGLAASTEYFFQVKARNGANAETTFGSTASDTTTAAATGIWISPMSAGTPIGSFYLGDTMGEWFINFEIGQASWDYAQIGIGTNTSGAGYNWGKADYYQDGDGSNKRVRRDLTGTVYTAAGTYYVICQAKAYSGDDYTSKSGNGWSNSTAYPPVDLASAYFTVSAINDPSDQSAEADQSSQINLFWNNNAQDHDVMVVRKLAAASWTEPAQGTSYAADDTLGAGTVIYKGGAGVFYDTGLEASTTYTYKFYSVNNDYYSPGVTAEETTLDCEPDAPAGLHASETNTTSFTAAWTASDRATGYRLDVSESETFGVAGAPVTIFTETMGTVGGTTTIAAHETANGFDNDGYTMSGGGAANPGDIRTSSASTGYAGASGLGNVYFTATANSYGFGIAGIDASGYEGLTLSFGYRKEATGSNATFAVEYSTDSGANWTPITVSGLPAENAGVAWYLISDLSLPVGAVNANLSLRWVKPVGSAAMRLDDVVLKGLPASASFVTGYEDLAVAGTSQLVEGLDENSTYYFRVRAEGEGGCPSGNSSTGSVTTLETTGGPQTITFPAIGDQVTTSVVVLAATASSGLDVSFAVLSGSADLDEDGVTLTFTGAGEVSVVASQAGGDGWDPAAPVTNTFNVTKLLAAVTLNDLTQAYDGTERVVTATTDPADLTVDVTYEGEATPPTDPGSYAVVATVVDDLYQGSDSGTLTVSVANPASFSATASGMSSIGLAFAANAAGNDVVIVANGTGTFSAPSGTPVVGESFAGGTVVYIGTSSPQTHSSLSSCAPYYYKAWSQVDGFYSAGLTDEAVTAAPAAPTNLGSVPGYADFAASWDAVTGATGYRLDVSTEADFTTGGGAETVYVADFEDAAKGSYGVGSVTLNGVSWNLNEAVIGDLANDRKNGLKSARVRSNETVNATGILSMNEDLATGLSSITFLYAKYGTDANTAGRAEYSTDGGANWTSAGTFTASSTELTPFSATNLNVTGNVRVRIVKTSGTTTRYNIDDIALYPYVPATPSFVAGFEDLAVAGTSQEVSGLAEGVTYYFRVRAEAGCTSADSATAAVTTLEHLRLVLSQASVNVRENGEGRFFVRLNKDPGASLAVSVGRSAGDESLALQGRTNWAFNSGNWSTWQAVTLVQADDANSDSEAATFQVVMTGVDPVTVEAATLDDDLGENLALATGGTTVSASYPCRQALLIDGVHNVRTNYGYVVCTSTPPGTITLDLLASTTVSRVRILTWDWVLLNHRYKIESSLNGTAWTTLIDASTADHHGWEDWVVDSVSARYLRFIGVSSTQGDAAVSVAELEVYGSRVLPDLPQLIEVSKSAVNVREAGEGRFFVRLTQSPAASKIVTVSYSEGSESIAIQSGASWVFNSANWNIWQPVTLAQAADGNTTAEETIFQIAMLGAAPRFVTATALDDDLGENLALASGGSGITGTHASRPALLIDGIHNVSTNYGHALCSTTPQGTMTLDLKTATAVSRVRILTWDWVNLGHRYVIESSPDGVDWTTVADATGADHSGWDDWAVGAESVRYLRFTAVATTQSQGALAVAELEVYGSRPLPELVQVSKSSVNVREGGEGRFFVRLAQNPGASVVVSVERSAGSAAITVASRTSWTFNAANWNIWQPVTLAAAADENAANETATIRIAMAGAAAATVSATALDVDIGENLALASGGATISGVRANQPGQLIDGVHSQSANYGSAIWTTVPAGTITLDLKGERTVSRVRLLNWDWTQRTQRYVLESSADGVVWLPLVDASGSDRAGWDDWAVADEAIRYLRLTAVTNSGGTQVVVAELEVYGTRSAGKGSLAAQMRGSLVTESEPISVLTSDGVEDETGWNAVDGDDTTAWVGQKAGGGYLVVEYAPTLTLKTLGVDLAEGSSAGVQGLYSLDAETWQPLPEDMEQNPVSLNFLWLVFPDDGTEAVPQVIEIQPNP